MNIFSGFHFYRSIFWIIKVVNLKLTMDLDQKSTGKLCVKGCFEIWLLLGL